MGSRTGFRQDILRLIAPQLRPKGGKAKFAAGRAGFDRWTAMFFGIAATAFPSLASSGAIGETKPKAKTSNTTRGRNMAGTVEQKLTAQGITLHEPPNPVANYVPFVRTGNLLFVSGQVCLGADGKLIAKGKLGAGVSVEQGSAGARGCAINLLAQVKAALGDLDKVVRVVRLGGFVNSAPDFVDGPKVLNGASDLMVAAFGDKGRHARTTVGVASLPADASVEVEGVFEVS
jgi:enamine deaminase RidA (YjgF/YER057c/UK114 family)